LTGTTDFSLPWSVRTGSGDPSNGYRVNFQRGRRAESKWPLPSCPRAASAQGHIYRFTGRKGLPSIGLPKTCSIPN